MPRLQNLPTNYAAFLDMIKWSEVGPELIAASDDGYNVLVGSTPSHPLLFSNYADHPRVINSALHSSAAGGYQTIIRTFDAYKERLSLPDFSPESQDAIAMQLIKERSGLQFLDAGQLRNAIFVCSNIWASLPGNSYGQPTHTIAELGAAFAAAGGTLPIS